MAKTQEELNSLKEEVETLNKKLSALTEEELEQVTGGRVLGDEPRGTINPEVDYCNNYFYDPIDPNGPHLCKNCRGLNWNTMKCRNAIGG